MRTPIDAFQTLFYTVADYTLGTAIVVVHGLRGKREKWRDGGGVHPPSAFVADAHGESELGVRHLH